MTSTSDPKPFVTGYPATGTAYPYPPPPPSHPAPYYAAPPPSANPTAYYAPTYPYYADGDNHRILFLRRLLVGAISIFLAIGAAVFILWLVLRPRLPEFSVTSLAVSSFNLSSSSLSSDFNLTLAARNPNRKMSINYDEVTAAVLYDGDTVIARTSLPPFHQGTKESTEVQARLAAVAEYVDDDVANGIRSERGKGGGAVRFHVRVLSLVRFRSGAWTMRNHVLRVFCEGVEVAFNSATASAGSMVGPPVQCQVGL